MLLELKAKHDANLDEAKRLNDMAAKENRDLTDEEAAKVDALLAEADALRERIVKGEERESRLRSASPIMGAPTEIRRGDGMPVTGSKSIGAQFVESEAFRKWLADVAPSGEVPEKGGLRSPTVWFKSLFEQKDLITGESDISAGAFVTPDRTGIYEPLGRIPLVLRDLISIRQTTSDLVEFVRQTAQVQEAAPVAEANVKYSTGATGEILGTKPQGRMTFQVVQTTVKTIAVYMAATRRALADAAQIRGIIDQELRDDIAEELEDQMLNGNGVNPNFTGIFNTPGILNQAFNTNILTTCRQAVTTIQVTGRSQPTAWLFNPTDWETVELLQDTNDRYYGNGPFAQGPNRLWGYPVVISQFVPKTRALLADWRKAVLWDRQRVSLYVTDSHEDWFVRNIIAILAEMRAAFGLIRPTAFVDVELA